MKYVIKPGDTLSEIAEKYKTSVYKLAMANGISNPDHIHSGVEIEVPGEDEGWAVVWKKLKELLNTKVV